MPEVVEQKVVLRDTAKVLEDTIEPFIYRRHIRNQMNGGTTRMKNTARTLEKKGPSLLSSLDIIPL